MRRRPTGGPDEDRPPHHDPPRRRGRRRLALGIAAAATAAVLPACSSSDHGNVIKWYAKEEAGGSLADAAKACTEQADGRYRIEQVGLPSDADAQREQLVRRLAAKDSDIDLMNMDVIWTAEFANAGWIRAWPKDKADAVTKGRLATAVKTATFRDRLYGAPLNSNTELLWYRSDLTKTPPKTWGEMIDAAKKLAQDGKPHLIQAQGQRYEGLVVWFTSLVESAGGSILNDAGTKVTLPEGPTKKALQVMADYSRSVAAPPTLATAQEDQGRQGWESGDSAFMVNYGFVWPAANGNVPPLAAKMRWTQYPGVDPGKPSKVAIGGFNIGVSSYAKHPDLAFEAAQCLTSVQNQIGYANKSGLLPVSESLYTDKRLTQATTEVTDAKTGKTKKVKAFPYAAAMQKALATAVIRPQTPYYNDVSLAISRTLHPTNHIDPDRDYPKLKAALEKALKGEGLL